MISKIKTLLADFLFPIKSWAHKKPPTGKITNTSPIWLFSQPLRCKQVGIETQKGVLSDTLLIHEVFVCQSGVREAQNGRLKWGRKKQSIREKNIESRLRSCLIFSGNAEHITDVTVNDIQYQTNVLLCRVRCAIFFNKICYMFAKL